MKSLIQRTLNYFGYELRVKSTNLGAFAVQKELIRNRNPMIFDVGAHFGTVTKKYRELFPLASIYAFEPFPQSFEKLRQNTADDAHTSVHNLAISNKNDVLFLNANANAATNSLLPTDTKGGSYWGAGLLDTIEQLQVNAISIDSFCEEKSISKVDILKLDIQGVEFLALTGAKKMLSNQLISLIYSEIIMAPTYKGQRKLHEYLSLLDSLGYEFFDLYNPLKKHMELIQADIIFLSNSFKQEIGET